MRVFDLTNHRDAPGGEDSARTEGRVYAVHTVRDDVSAAVQFGQITYINTRYVYPDELSDDGDVPARVAHELHRAAEEFDPAIDYLLLVGDHVQICKMISLLTTCGKAPFMVLRYDRQEQGYIPVRI